MRVELPGKVNGSAIYSIDLQVPGMIYGAVLESPVNGARQSNSTRTRSRLCGCDRDRAASFRRRCARGNAVGSVRRQGAVGQSITWSRVGKAWGFDSDKGIEAFAAAARDPGVPVTTDWFKQGDAAEALRNATTVVEAEYRCDYAYHAQMEPLNAVAASRRPAMPPSCGVARKARRWPSIPPPRRSASRAKGQSALYAARRRLRPARSPR